MTNDYNRLMKFLNKYKNMEKFSFGKDKDDEKSIFPLPLRCLLVGKSGSSKTMLL